MSLVSVVCYQVEVCMRGRLLISRSPTEGGVSEYDLENSTVVVGQLVLLSHENKY